jgi:phenol 2-monooxygenase (NADPH)
MDGNALSKVPVLIVGSGSAGLCAALWLSIFGIDYLILEQRQGPLERGQADGVQTRTVEIFESFGISEPMLAEAYHVLEIGFWSAALEDRDAGQRMPGIRRTHFAADTEPGLSHMPHVILNQARVNGIMMEEIARRRGRPLSTCIEYGVEVISVDFPEGFDTDKDMALPVTVIATKDGVERKYLADYVLVSSYPPVECLFKLPTARHA